MTTQRAPVRETLRSETYVGSQCRLDEVRMAGHWRHARARPNTLKPHMHATAYEICYVADGVTEWWVEERRYEVQRGQFSVTKPFELHGGVDTSTMPDELYWVQIVMPPNGGFPGLTEAETRRIEAELRNIAPPCFHAVCDPSPIYERLLASLRDTSDFASIALRSAIHDLLLCVIASLPRQSASRFDQSSPHIDAALSWIDAHLADDYAVDDLADACGIATSHLHRLFAAVVGVTPGDYRTRRRIGAAKQMLRGSSQSITDIALELGFSSSQYFATVFKSLTGMTPRMFRAYANQEDPLSRTPDYID